MWKMRKKNQALSKRKKNEWKAHVILLSFVSRLKFNQNLLSSKKTWVFIVL